MQVLQQQQLLPATCNITAAAATAALMCLVRVSNLSVTELRAIWWEVMGGM